MVPEAYVEFFVATATVAGALVGLLFVAVSVRPEAAARTAHITTRLRSVAALSAFLDTLFLSLLALRPQPAIGRTAAFLAVIGIVAMATLLVLLVVQGRDRPRHLVRGTVLVLLQGYVYVLQLTNGLALVAAPTDASRVDDLAIIVVVLFGIGIARAWEFIGADNTSLLGTLGSVARRRPTAADAADDAADDTRATDEAGRER